MVKAPPESEISTSSGPTPANSQRTTKSSPTAKMSVVGTQAVAWVRRPSSCPPPLSAYSRIRAISLIVSITPRNGFRALPIFPPSDLVTLSGLPNADSTNHGDVVGPPVRERRRPGFSKRVLSQPLALSARVLFAARLPAVLRGHLLGRWDPARAGHRPVRFGGGAGVRPGQRHPLFAQRLEERVDHADHDERERRPGYDRDRLQAFESPEQEGHGRRGARESPPEGDDGALGVQGAPGGEHAHHHRGRVGPADKEDADEQDRYERRHRRQGELGQRGEQRRLLTVGHGLGDVGPPEDVEPQEADQARDQQHPEGELPDRPAARDPGYERPHERPPGGPPNPVEDGPAGQERFVPVGRGREAHRYEVEQVVPDRGHEGVCYVERRAHEQHEEQQQHGEHHVAVGEPLDAALHARDRRDDKQRRYDGDDDDRNRRGLRNAPDKVEPAVHLQRAEAQRGTRPEQGGEDRQYVQRLSGPAFHPVPQY